MILKKKDIKLLVSLFENSRKSNRLIAKEIKVSKETVGSRINYFIENNIIKGYSLKINYEKLGFIEYNFFIRLRKVNQETFDMILNYFEKHQNTTWVGKSFGKYDLKVAIYVKDSKRISELVHEISSKFGKNIEIFESVLIVEKFKASSNKKFLEKLFDEKNLEVKSEINLKKNNLKEFVIDEIDKQIIYEFGQGKRINYVEGASKINMTAEGIKYRFLILEKNNFILGTSIVLNGNKFNKIWCQVLLNINPEKILKLKNYLKTQDYLSNYVEMMGVWNFSYTVFATNIEELYLNLNKIRSEFSEHLRDQEILIFFDIYKYPKIPKCILD